MGLEFAEPIAQAIRMQDQVQRERQAKAAREKAELEKGVVSVQTPNPKKTIQFDTQ